MSEARGRSGGAPRSEAAGRIPAPIRHARIRDAFRRDGFVSVSDIARDLGVSAMTIRRDLVALARAGEITRTHGGAVPPTEAERGPFDAEEPVFDSRVARNADAKLAIARRAARLVGPRESVGLDVGTTVMALAGELAQRTDLRVFTNNVRAAMRLAGCGSPVYILGGEVRPPEFSVIGAGAVQQLRAHFLDRVFLGVSGLGELGLFDYSPEDTEVKRAFLDCAESVVVVCDATKFGRRALSRIAPLDAIDILVTDQAPPPELAAALEAAQVDVIVADGRG
ncbi:DeoR/GlpR family DNA-binding transcription regulator [Oharaeibacter diazotrophicus]|uniref:DeoR family transcriptional regulator n=1 Tax=Oharaeibacter diazotrophicus TaxID=1920512 RepID=A0A4R6RAR5_9HYPH|nr:DeoR/GlpR family DNA-binding transcription regulator [Oharaeibacter diazotrophicus]TDP83074.1 DeoR family transcriptional regulator [Oharaeibacter diazotrophicus]BBE71905.1 glycerol-3-phosphate regulon repressor [Pleomorphomonas sp. SM30]GLS78668.1 DeoR family transcriptional regulator [Oharaeibacter diazotrophicus]